jgi:uncharacterized membrane protein (GlpM family)
MASGGNRTPVNDLLAVALKGLVGGGLVVMFALLSETLQPKRFAGLFSAAPAVAIAGLALTLVFKEAHEARENSIGMLAGASGMTAYALAIVVLMRRVRPFVASVLGLVAWILPAAAVAALLL